MPQCSPHSLSGLRHHGLNRWCRYTAGRVVSLGRQRLRNPVLGPCAVIRDPDRRAGCAQVYLPCLSLAAPYLCRCRLRGPKLREALEEIGDWTVEIIKRSNSAKGFEVLPSRWVVERTFAWLGRCRRLAKDWEKSIASAEVWLLIAHTRPVTRRLAKYCY